MFNRIQILNYRGFSNLEITQLSRINLVTGENNSGKTSLLETLFLLCGAGNPSLVVSVNLFRDLQPQPSSAAPEIAWKPMFAALDMTRPVEIVGHHNLLGRLSLKIEVTKADTVELSRSRLDAAGNPLTELSGSEFSNTSKLLLTFDGTPGKKRSASIIPTTDGFRGERPASNPPFNAVFLSSRSSNANEDAVRLGQLRKQKRGDLLLNALQMIEPKLRSVEDSSASGHPMIWGDIGLSELVPLSVMGDGMRLIARLILAISAAPHGVVLVDEVENGLHHSVLGKVWKAIQQAAIQFDTQVFATTHSFECVEAAHKSLSENNVSFHRLEVHDQSVFCVSYGPSEIKAAIAHGLEVR